MVLLPCSKCCPKCGCNSCICCECDGSISGDSANTTTKRWSRFMSGLLTGTDATDMEDALPCFAASSYRRFVTSKSYSRLISLLPDCQISRRWGSQSACVDALIAAEVAAIVAAGTPYTYDPWYGYCGIPTKVGDSLTIEATFGSGAKAEISKQANCSISEITVTDGGSGYARYARIAPTLTIAGGSGTGATFSPSLSSSGTPTVWALASATASGGTGYVDGESLTITAATGDTVVTAATATVQARGEPTLTATGSGSGAEFSITLSKSGTPPTWAVSTVSVTKAGTGYTHQSSLTFSPGTGVTLTAASAAVRTLEQPTFSVDASGAGGAGATFSISYTPGDGTYWEITGISITNGGSGYTAGGTVTLSPGTGDYVGIWPEGDPSPLELSYTVSGGAIDSISGFDGYGFYRDRGQVQSVTVGSGGSYYGTTGPAYGVTVTNGGQYYREDKSGTPDVATLTIYDSRGSKVAAEYTGTIDDDTASATFGKITAIDHTGGFGGNPLLPTPTSSLTPQERQDMLNLWCVGNEVYPPDGFDGFFAPLQNHEPLTFANLAEVEDKIAELYGAAGPMDAAAIYKGYCSATTLLKDDGSKYLLGWSTPYRRGAPLTPAVMAGLCTGGLPWKNRPNAGTYPAVFTAWGTAIFANDDIPPVRSVTLEDTTGDTVVDRLLETGTQGIQVVRDELNDPLDDYAKTITLTNRDDCNDKNPGDITIGNTYTSGEKTFEIAITKSDGGTPSESWYLTLTFVPCTPKEDLPPNGAGGPYITEYGVSHYDHATSTTTDVTADLIADTLAFRPYTSEADCKAQNLRDDAMCENGLWEFYGVGLETSLALQCCYGTIVDDDTHDAE